MEAKRKRMGNVSLYFVRKKYVTDKKRKATFEYVSLILVANQPPSLKTQLVKGYTIMYNIR